MPSPHFFLFGSLALNQTLFFEALGDALEQAGHGVAYLCFHERSHEYLVARGKRSFNAFVEGGDDQAIDLSLYDWPSLNLVLSHEKAAFEIYDTPRLSAKLRRYLAASEAALAAVSGDASRKVLLVQELGGFLSNVATFYSARRRGIDNVFIEPSFYRGRVFFVRNSFGARGVSGPRAPAVSAEVAGYLENALARQQIVIPAKDTHHYRGPIKKLTDLRNARRLVQKVVDKYVHGKREVFGHIGGHVARHVRMYRNSRKLARNYRGLPARDEPFVYYPLHVPADVALTIRAPEYRDQMALIDFLARTVPETHLVLIKEHPALVGAMDHRSLAQLLARRDNVRLLNPGLNNYDVLRRADAVITVNSKSGAEALLLGQRVVVLGDAFYTPCDLVHRARSLAELSSVLRSALETECKADRLPVMRYFQDIWDASWPGELFVASPNNARAMSASLIRYLEADSADV
jgi:hypothetical protein